MKRFFRNASAPAEEPPPQREPEPQPEPEITIHKIWHPPAPGRSTELFVLVDEAKAQAVYKSKSSKLIKTSKGKWVIVTPDGYGWGGTEYNVGMPQVYGWFEVTKLPLPKEVEEWARSVTE